MRKLTPQEHALSEAHERLVKPIRHEMEAAERDSMKADWALIHAVYDAMTRDRAALEALGLATPCEEADAAFRRACELQEAYQRACDEYDRIADPIRKAQYERAIRCDARAEH